MGQTLAIALGGALGAVARFWAANGVYALFTTFSTFSIETINLIEGGALLKAMLNMVLSVVLCVVAAWLGLLAGRQL